MEKTVQERAYAKINLTLGVTGRRADGYHLLDSLMVTIDLHDEVTVTRSREVIVTCTGMLLPYRNTLRAAAERYRALTGRGARIHVYKRIPAEAGLGGGSADAAAALRALQRMYGEAEERDLYDIALRVGADVPFCLKGGLCRVQGVGEALTPLRMEAQLHLALARPRQGVSTGKLFRALTLPQPLPDTAGALAALAVQRAGGAGHGARAGDRPAAGAPARARRARRVHERQRQHGVRPLPHGGGGTGGGRRAAGRPRLRVRLRRAERMSAAAEGRARNVKHP